MDDDGIEKVKKERRSKRKENAQLICSALTEFEIIKIVRLKGIGADGKWIN